MTTLRNECKQIIINKHNNFENPNWQEADQLAIDKSGEVEFGAAYRRQIHSATG